MKDREGLKFAMGSRIKVQVTKKKEKSKVLDSHKGTDEGKRGKEVLAGSWGGYEEEGRCCAGRKEGVWRVFFFFFFCLALRQRQSLPGIFFSPPACLGDAETKGYVPNPEEEISALVSSNSYICHVNRRWAARATGKRRR